ncbi:AI-2E family transporter [Vagococcus fluvialis]|uniref:AI-2E family transporter n=1 Tax=Vagococcus fluvialis TaxID=2738 RepID=A0A7X6D6W2_9ENTE|nr:AI-2E family transporter [Vagococcus fluvialis]MDR2277016.1 AI-2E family transporter [Vagococcus sp.]MBO0444364.1 AI-2E family transporter [Vagococcus fluvialis]MBO0479356.1 AI-2E family transporter [Vagococcus fluvialis]MBO0485264.1 AI-2E family transporter [Vagococcus fluvialis]MBO0487270.1 AI-2E family transporter [Vagococcus fluvialis]
MFDRFKRSKLMFWSVELLVIATLILVGTQISFIFKPIGTMFTTMFSPILISGFLFYCFKPIVTFLEKKGVSKTWGATIVLLLLVGIVVVSISSIIPSLVKQIAALLKSAPTFIKEVESWANEMSHHPMLQNIDFQSYLDKWNISIGNIVQTTINGVSSSIGSFVSSIAGIVMLVVTVPFILFYMLKDGHKMIPAIQKYFPEKHKGEMVGLLKKMSETIEKYISGQMIECLFVGVGTSLGYMIIGVDYAFLFGVIAGLTNMIPYIGPYIGLAPAVIVTVFADPWKAVFACIVVLIVQQIDGNIIYPNVIGKSLDIHPLTIIIILLVAGNLAGLLGMILGVPFYAVCKTIFVYVFDMVQLSKSGKKTEEVEIVDKK